MMAAGAAGAYYGQNQNQNNRVSNPRSAKEMEAMRMRMGGSRVMNPDSEYPPENGGPSMPMPMGMPAPNAHNPNSNYPSEQARQAYLQYGPNNGGALPAALQPGRTQSLSTSQSRSESYAGSSVIVHRDGGRVEMPRKGQEAAEEEEQQMPTEIPPTYDSLLQGKGQGQEQQTRTDG
jgi:hypothetical protein